MLVLLAPLTGFAAPDTKFDGAYTWGHEVNTFQSCGDSQVYWVSASAPVLDQLKSYHDSVPGAPYRSIYVSIRGEYLDEELDGFAAQYDGLIQVREVLSWDPDVPLECAANSTVQCDWTSSFPIPNEEKLEFQECRTANRLRIGGIEVQATIEFDIVHSHYPEGNSIWSRHSSDGKTAVVWIENENRERNAWVIDPQAGEVLLFTDRSEGHHFNVEFDNNDRFRIVHAGMGYRADDVYERVDGLWTHTGRDKVDVE